MTIPGFTAQVSIYNPTTSYRMMAGDATATLPVVPAAASCSACYAYRVGPNIFRGNRLCCNRVCSPFAGCRDSCWVESCNPFAGGGGLARARRMGRARCETVTEQFPLRSRRFLTTTVEPDSRRERCTRSRCLDLLPKRRSTAVRDRTSPATRCRRVAEHGEYCSRREMLRALWMAWTLVL